MNAFILHSGAGAPGFNMALDEALLEAMSRLQTPVLRFYAWTEPAATFGYFQHYANVARATPLRPLIRRPTGGGIVPHDADWTYSLAFPPGHEWHRLRAEASYRRAHEWIQAAFARLNGSVSLASERKISLPGQCFAGHEKFDVLWHGKKIAGAAQRRNQSGLLIQGSVQPPPLIQRSAWEAAMLEITSNNWSELPPDDVVFARARKLLTEKYSQSSYNERR